MKVEMVIKRRAQNNKYEVVYDLTKDDGEEIRDCFVDNASSLEEALRIARCFWPKTDTPVTKSGTAIIAEGTGDEYRTSKVFIGGCDYPVEGNQFWMTNDGLAAKSPATLFPHGAENYSVKKRVCSNIPVRYHVGVGMLVEGECIMFAWLYNANNLGEFVCAEQELEAMYRGAVQLGKKQYSFDIDPTIQDWGTSGHYDYDEYFDAIRANILREYPVAQVTRAQYVHEADAVIEVNSHEFDESEFYAGVESCEWIEEV